MVRGLSLSTLSTSGDCSMCGGSTHLWKRNYKVMKKTQVTSGVERLCLWHQGAQTISFTGHKYISRERNLRVEAGWLFNGGEKGFEASLEHSESANEDILIFFFQLDLATRVQFAMNLEEYEVAQQLRNKLTEVEAEVIRQKETKRGSASKSEAQDKAISLLCLRADQHSAIEKEDYPKAAELRDEISKLEAESLTASVKAQLYENAQYAFRLGQKVRHKKFGYRAVVCGMDPVCCESSSWKEIAQVEKLTRGPDQPFYQVLVDVNEDPNLLVAYVPEENLLAPDRSDTGRFDHPYVSFLFYGMDAAGDFIPIKQLRDKYNRPRHEVPYDPHDENIGGDV